jgi:uncharacterized membrane protein YqgA involved in biofilm formation
MSGISQEVVAIGLTLAAGMIGYAIRMERLLTKLVTEMEQSNKQHMKTEHCIGVLDTRLDDHETRIKVIEST